MGAVGFSKVKLSDREITIDLHLINITEYRFAIKDGTDADASDAVVAKACGLKVKELQGLPMPDYTKIIDAWWQAAREPLEGRVIKLTAEQAEQFGVKFGERVQVEDIGDITPNSPSASTKD